MPDARLRMTPSPSSSRKTTSSLTFNDESSERSATSGSVTYGRMGLFGADQRIELSLWTFAAAVRLLYLAAARPAFVIYYWEAASAGGWLGLVTLTRAVAWPLLLVAPIAAARSGRRAIVMAGAAVLVLLPYAIRNYTLNGAIVPARGGINLLIGNSEYSAGVIADYGPGVLLPYAESRIAAEGLVDVTRTPEVEQRRDAAYRRLALAGVRE